VKTNTEDKNEGGLCMRLRTSSCHICKQLAHWLLEEKKERKETTGFIKITLQDKTEESQTPKQLIICNKVYNTY
jgi:hypothetical protein